MANKGHFTINGVTYYPKSIKPSFDSLASEDSGRTDDGVMHITWIQRSLRKWEIEMPPCDSATASSLLNAVQGKEYNINIFDIKSNSYVTAHVYTSASQADCYSGVVHNGIWQGLSFNAIEVGNAQ